MKKKLKISFDPKKSHYKSDLLNDISIPIITENEDLQYSNRESIINDLKQKGFNELQIGDIFETFKRNSVSNRYPINEERDFSPIAENHTIDTNIFSTNRKGKRIERKERLNSNSKYKNSFVIKTENVKKQEFYKSKPIKYNCAKLYVNASSEKYRKNYFYLREKKESKYKNNIKIENYKRKKINPIIISSANNSNPDRIYSRKVNQKVENYHSKFKLSYRNSMNDIENQKNENLKKYEFDDNYNNYNFKIIFETKKVRDRINNIGYLDIKSIKSKKGREIHFKSRNDKKEENKSNISNSVNSINNSHIYIKNKKVNKNDTIDLNLKEIKEEKDNNQFKEIKVNKINKNIINDSNNSNNDIELNKKYSDEKIKKKFCNQMVKEFKTINDIDTDEKIIKDNNNNNQTIKNKFEKKYSSNTHNIRKERNSIPNNFNYKNNILVIRQQNSEDEEEKISNENNFISIIKQDDEIDKKTNINIESNSNIKNNYVKNIEKNFKSRSLSKISNKDNTNTNHSFISINLCKDKYKNSSIFNEKKIVSIKENKNNNNNKNILKKAISYEEIILNKNDSNIISKEKIDFSKEINTIEEDNTENEIIINKRNAVNNIIRLNKIPNPKQHEKNIKIKLPENKNTIHRSITYNLTTKKYPNGTYKGFIFNGKREKNGTMFFDNGAKYEGQWKNDKKHGKGVFTSSHYFDCKNFVGMKYEGEFKDDKFDGFGITTYTNGDKYEGEWKNNKQYGKGVVTYFNGEKYDGEWVDGFFEGIGIFYLKNGERFEGRFKDNKYNGYGKYFYLNGEWLEGIFKNDHPSGNCLLHKKDGNIINVAH